jgi:ATP-binding cassette subfamily B protein
MGAGFTVNMIQRGAVALARVNEVLETEPAIRSPEHPPRPGILSFPEPSGEAGEAVVEIRNLSFAYPGGEPVLEDINLTIERGTVVGILGRTGSGKSTLIKTLVRLVDPPPGTVFVKGLAVEQWDLSELRRVFGVSPQDSYLFSDTIKQNIAYGVENPDDALLAGAAGIAALDRDLETFSQGWETLIGERGLTLSGGQKQRLAVSRAIIGGAEALILDDAFSAVDAETETRILGGLLEELRRGASSGKGARTAIIVSHRVSTLRNADKVVVLDKGRVSEYGGPQELIAGGGFYARAAALQRLAQGETGV